MLIENEVEWTFDVTDCALVTPVIRKILNSLKLNEITSSRVKSDCDANFDGEQVSKYGPDYRSDLDLVVDISLLKLVKIYDLYRD